MSPAEPSDNETPRDRRSLGHESKRNTFYGSCDLGCHSYSTEKNELLPVIVVELIIIIIFKLYISVLISHITNDPPNISA